MDAGNRLWTVVGEDRQPKPEVTMMEWVDPAALDKTVSSSGGFMVQTDGPVEGLKMAKDGKVRPVPSHTLSYQT